MITVEAVKALSLFEMKSSHEKSEINIKHELTNEFEKNVSEHNILKGKIMDYQFAVFPKQEPTDVKTESDWFNNQKYKLEVQHELLNGAENISKPIDDTLTGKVINYQFVVYPKQESAKVIKTELNKLDLVGEVIEWDKESKLGCNTTPRQSKSYLGTSFKHYCKVCKGIFPIKKHDVHLELLKIRKNPITDSNPYVCFLCDIVFNNVHNALKHLFLHDRNKFNCNLCTYTAQELLDLNYHKKTVHNLDSSKVYSCIECNYKTNYKLSLNAHFNTVHANKVLKFKCDQCNECWPDEDHNVHEKFKHITRKQISEENPFVCKECDLKFTTDDNIYGHLKDHGDIGHFCNLCSFNSDNQSELEGHKQLKHPDQIKSGQDEKKEKLRSIAVCNECNLLWPDRNHETHLKMLKITEKGVSHTSPYECCACNTYITDIERVYYHLSSICVKIHCDKCSYTSFLESAMKRHKRKVHSQVEKGKTFYCDLCDYKGNSLRGLKKHQATHKSGKEKVYYHCEQCLFKTPYRWFMQKHVLKTHESQDLKELPCPDCTYTTKYADNLRRHIRTNHTNEVYSCTQCPYQAKNKKQFKMHKHQEYVCEECAQVFRSIQALNVHKESKHNFKPLNANKYVCHTCNYESYIKRKFLIHIKKHQKIRNIRMYCANCEYTTLIKTNLIQHMIKHTDPSKLKMHKCTICPFITKRPHTLRNHIKSHAIVRDNHSR